MTLTLETCKAPACARFILERRVLDAIGTDLGECCFCACHGRAFCSPRCRDDAHGQATP